ncbi:MAG: ThuA domain-containing protein [Acidobacteriota bacterium]
MTPLVWRGVLATALLTCACWSDRSPIGTSAVVPPTPAAAPARVLVVTHTAGFVHSSIPVAEATLAALGQRSGLFTVTFCRTADDVARLLSRAGLSDFDATVFANTTGTLPVGDVGALLNWIAEGHGFAGMHSASDTFHDAPAYLEMLGNQFRTHGDQTTVDAIVENGSHPASSPLGPRFRVFDEIYKFTRPNRGSVTMLLSLDRHPLDGLPEAGQPGDLPLAWAKNHGQGRVFYTALGHREDVWENALYQQHVLGGIRWMLGQ